MNPLAWLLVAFVAICAVCALACWIGDDTITVQPEPRHHPCHICNRAGYYTDRRRDTGLLEWTCVGCHDEGTAWGWWAA